MAPPRVHETEAIGAAVRSKRWRQAHPDQVNEITRAYKANDREAWNQWHLAYSKERRADLAGWINGMKLESGCVRCGYNKCAPALSFHHINSAEKEISIATAIHKCYSRDRLLAEIAKCEIICNNCHAEEHWA
jgi:hypothetical protein